MEQSDSKTKILFLDDDKFIVDLYSLKFSHVGFEFQAAMSVDEALSVLRGGFTPDIVICDLVLAKSSGFDFLNIIHTEHLAQGAYVIVLTNQSDDLDKVQAQELGADRYIVKVTMVPDEVVSIIEEVMAHRKAA